MIAEANPRKRVRYVAYNKSARKDAEARFPARNTRCSTSHGLAFRPMIETMSGRIEAKTRFMAGNERARIMGLTGPTRLTADRGRKVAFPKGVGELIAMVKGAEQIKAGEPCEHVDLMAFATWAQVQDYAENEPDGKDLKQFVDLVDEHGTDGLMDILRQIGNEEKGDASDITISTAHMAKGREWRQVLIADDFHEPKRDPSAPASALPRIPREDAMLAYVAVTRAQFVAEVDPGLSWVDNYAGATVTDDTDEPVDDGQPPATVTPASMTVTADPAVLAAIKAKIAEMFPGATVELGTELAVAAG